MSRQPGFAQYNFPNNPVNNLKNNKNNQKKKLNFYDM
jgi:hypothetical protein